MDQEQNTTAKTDSLPTAISQEKSNLSMFVGVGAFLIILAGLGWYVVQGGEMKGNLFPDTPAAAAVNNQTASTGTSSEDVAATALSTQGTSDSVADINADLKATNLDSLNDLNKI